MSFLYLISHGDVLGIKGGYFKITHLDKSIEYIPKATVDGISVFAKVQLTSDAIDFCLTSGINVSYFSESGFYYGTLTSTNGSKTNRLRTQVMLCENNDFKILLAQKVMYAKINNQLVVVKRYLKDNSANPKEELFHLRYSRRKVLLADNITKIMGYEGIASRNYFNSISKFIESDFYFTGRNRRPSRDPFNCMLNFAYSMLYKEICGEIVNRGLNPYIGFIHSEKTGHAALASDLIEEWRAPIVDSVVLSLIQGHEIKRDMFRVENSRCFMSNEAKRILIAKLERRMFTEIKYLSYIDKPVTYRMALWHQIERLSRAIDSENADIYEPVMIR